jgi:hypothetical protein
MTAYQNAGYHVEVCILRRGTRYDGDNLLNKLQESGTPYHILAPKPIDKEQDYLKVAGSYEEVAFASVLQKLCKDKAIDILLLYSARCAAATAIKGEWPYRVCFTVDLDHLARLARLNFDLKYGEGKSRFIRYIPKWFRFQKLRRNHVKVLTACDRVVSHAYNHSVWLQKKGVNVKYLPLPVYDSGKTIAQKRKTDIVATRQNKLKLAMIGTPAGIATLSGYSGFTRKILPMLDKEIGAGNYEVHIIGNFKGLPKGLEKQIRAHGSVVIRGYVEDLSEEFYTSDAILVPTPLPLGFRTRIAEAFSYGSCVIAHQSNKAGMPELEDGKNILLAKTEREIAQLCKSVHLNATLKRTIGLEARKTFEKYYDSEVVCARMIEQS